MAVIDGIFLGPVQVRRVGVEGVNVGIPVEDARNILLIADSWDTEDIVTVGVEFGYSEPVVERFANALLRVFADLLFTDAPPAEPEEDEPKPKKGLTTTASLSME